MIKIFVVEDDVDLNRFVSSSLRNVGYDVVSCFDGLEALEKMDEEKYEPFNLTEALAESVVEFETLIEKKNIELNCHFDDVRIFSSKSLLEIVWNNLISNAIKFTPSGGDIDIFLQCKDKDVEIQVADTGVGMTSEVGEKIFEKFYQGDTSHSTQGNGLGLALVKKVIDILGGEIAVQSELNKGSTFTILLKDVVYEI